MLIWGGHFTSTQETKETSPYPRPRVLRALRWIFSFWWLIFVWYVLNVLFNLYGAFERSDFGRNLTLPGILQALYIDRVVDLLQHPLQAILALSALTLLIFIGLWARQDRRREARYRLEKHFSAQQVSALYGAFRELDEKQRAESASPGPRGVQPLPSATPGDLHLWPDGAKIHHTDPTTP